ncbi:MAG: hypothetical protein HOB02_07755 [Proteobacteria bacterium]|nr:hypothetical protein [Pseudomonadota bacterium]
MRRISINHLRTIKMFADKPLCKTSDWESFLTKYVSPPTARKIIGDLIELKIVRVDSSSEDGRVRLLTVVESDIERFL